MLHPRILFSACFARIDNTYYSRLRKTAVQTMAGELPCEQHTTVQLHPKHWWTRVSITPTYRLIHCCDRRDYPPGNDPNKSNVAKAQGTTSLNILVSNDFNPMNACRLGEATNPGPVEVIVDKPPYSVWAEWLDGYPQQELKPRWPDGKTTALWQCGHTPGRSRPPGPQRTMRHLSLSQLLVKYKLQHTPVSIETSQQLVHILRH